MPEQSNMQQPALEWDELLGYLREIEDFNKPPLEALLAQTEVVGDPSMPKPAECAVLRWIDRIFQEWEQSFPLEWELTHKLRALKPAMAIASLSEEAFFRPGQHSLHQMMDAIHDSAIGWQGDLGRAGQPIMTLVESAISDVRAYLEQSGDVRAIADRVIAEAARIRARAKKMTERTIAAEQGRLRAARAKTIAANMINEQLQRYPAPAALNSLLQGPWYASAQLTYLKFGDESTQWHDFSKTTGLLLQAMQPLAELGDEEREQRQKLATILPAELRRQLLSIQHETDTLQQEVSSFEYLLQRVAQNQPIELSYLLPVASGAASSPPPADAAGARVGQWYEVCNDSDVLRLRVAMLEAGEVLLCNTSGAKGLSMPLAEFTGKIRTGDAQPLAIGATFSRAAAVAAGIDSDEALAKLSSPSGAQSASIRTGAAPTPADGDSVPGLPIGTWLGFHDTDPPMLAKLALHDRAQSLLIFVNRQGIELRRVGEDEYLELINAGQVDILEARNNFREQVERARTQMQQKQGQEGL